MQIDHETAAAEAQRVIHSMNTTRLKGLSDALNTIEDLIANNPEHCGPVPVLSVPLGGNVDQINLFKSIRSCLLEFCDAYCLPDRAMAGIEPSVPCDRLEYGTSCQKHLSAAFESVFPQSNISEFVRLTPQQRAKQVEEVAKLCLGIRLFGIANGQGGLGVANVPTLTVDEIDLLIAELERFSTVSVESARDLIDALASTQHAIHSKNIHWKAKTSHLVNHISNEDVKLDGKAVFDASISCLQQTQGWKDLLSEIELEFVRIPSPAINPRRLSSTSTLSTMSIEQFLHAGNVSSPGEIVSMACRQWTHELVHRRQLSIYLSLLLNDVREKKEKVGRLIDNYQDEIQALRFYLSKESTVKKELVYPRFQILADIWITIAKERVEVAQYYSIWKTLSKYSSSSTVGITSLSTNFLRQARVYIANNNVNTIFLLPPPDSRTSQDVEEVLAESTWKTNALVGKELSTVGKENNSSSSLLTGTLNAPDDEDKPMYYSFEYLKHLSSQSNSEGSPGVNVGTPGIASFESLFGNGCEFQGLCVVSLCSALPLTLCNIFSESLSATNHTDSANANGASDGGGASHSHKVPIVGRFPEAQEASKNDNGKPTHMDMNVGTGLPLQGDVGYGVVQYKGKVYMFSSPDAVRFFLQNPSFYLQRIITIALQQWELINLLGLHQFTSADILPASLNNNLFSTSILKNVKEMDVPLISPYGVSIGGAVTLAKGNIQLLTTSDGNADVGDAQLLAQRNEKTLRFVDIQSSVRSEKLDEVRNATVLDTASQEKLIGTVSATGGVLRYNKKGKLVSDAGVETPVHFIERHIDPNYTFSEWTMRRKALQILKIRKCITSTTQTDASAFRRDNTSQTFQQRQVSVQTNTSRGTNTRKTITTLVGTRHGPDNFVKAAIERQQQGLFALESHDVPPVAGPTHGSKLISYTYDL